MQISPREKRLVYGGAVILIIILIWNFLSPSSAGPSMKGMVSLKEAQKNTDLNKRTQSRLAREVQELDPDINSKAYNSAPDQLVPTTVRELQKIALKSGVHIRDIKPVRSKVLASGMGAGVPIEVHFLAPFQPNAMKFLYYVEDPAGKMVVDKLDISSADPRQKTVEVSALVTVYTRNTAGAFASDSGDKSNATSSK